MAGPTGAEAELSVRRSKMRRRMVIGLSSLTEAFPAQLARYAGTTPFVVKCVMRGHPPRYREELSLIALGLARERWTRNGRVYEITAKGRRKARSLTAAVARRAERRALLEEDSDERS